ncbi:MAG: fused MFS/spermidine synthase [Deltaproteobacteria bacterium]|nr:fused MFS/spermidine synthase [Deltaproteobacteria bacterium]
MTLHALTVLLSAFLLFQVQPIAGKMTLTWFGGSASVWSVCMVFFQTTLLLGYLYAHFLHERLAPRRQALLHTLLLLASLSVLPLAADSAWKSAIPDQPGGNVLAALAATVGLPYFLLSTTGPLVQTWYARSTGGKTPYRLYALSNLGSMVALLSYPVVVEPFFTLGAQRLAWSAGYALFVTVCVLTGWRSCKTTEAAPPPREREAAPVRPRLAEIFLWTALAACASTLLSASTRHITQDVAPTTFLWILPLALYLLSFIICFETPRGYHRPTFLTLLVLALVGAALALDERFHTVTTVAVLLSSTFVCAMVCHGELARRKPHPRYLTTFYVSLSVGGALGGAFVGLAAPALFNAYFEYPLGLALCAVLAGVAAWGSAGPAIRRLVVVAAPCYCLWLAWISRDYVDGYRKVVRNFYAQLRVDDVDVDGLGTKRKLFHGRITHGEQFVAAGLRGVPTAYYCRDGGVGQVLLGLDASVSHRIGIVGLGVGTLAAYGKDGDTLRIYEINDSVLDLARTEFTYLDDSAAHLDTVLGDARRSLEEEPDQRFDVLVVDAFSGDSIPTHLLTLEAFASYLRHLRADGVLAIHITNRSLDLRPVVAAAAARYNRLAVVDRFSPDDDDPFCRAADWAFVSTPARVASLPARELLAPTPGFAPWTDDYSNLLQILR